MDDGITNLRLSLVTLTNVVASVVYVWVLNLINLSGSFFCLFAILQFGGEKNEEVNPRFREFNELDDI